MALDTLQTALKRFSFHGAQPGTVGRSPFSPSKQLGSQMLLDLFSSCPICFLLRSHLDYDMVFKGIHTKSQIANTFAPSVPSKHKSQKALHPSSSSVFWVPLQHFSTPLVHLPPCGSCVIGLIGLCCCRAGPWFTHTPRARHIFVGPPAAPSSKPKFISSLGSSCKLQLWTWCWAGSNKDLTYLTWLFRLKKNRTDSQVPRSHPLFPSIVAGLWLLEQAMVSAQSEGWDEIRSLTNCKTSLNSYHLDNEKTLISNISNI